MSSFRYTGWVRLSKFLFIYLSKQGVGTGPGPCPGTFSVPVPDFRDQDRGIPGTLSRMPTPGRNATNGVWPGGRAIEVKGSNKGFHIFHELQGTF